ncbi:prostaglandin E2 receptor EP2 subtype [Sceloporus undulatus]|uniref:prostaglandin E2 receptor EP2 subtype n=1 Tax=Sceloporus undulatus TaxID=8520 RepID=UPI001C4B4DB2|nr:prostaglandin E2 receptor EP2 subtype [Sceloporus undulatus]
MEPRSAASPPSPPSPPGPTVGDEKCQSLELMPGPASPSISAVMFSAGLLGNLLALGLLLWSRRGRRRGSRGSLAPFRVLVTGLVLTDLLGTCLLSPMVLASYGARKSLRGLDGGEGRLCQAFAFAMSFFSLATMGCLGAMALERSLALGAPYFYQRLPRGLWWAALPAFDALAAAFCALPLLGFGHYVQYCPGTWCFIQTHWTPPSEGDPGGLAFALLYASLLLLLILAVLLGNLSAIRSLAHMHRRRGQERLLAPRRALALSQELDHLLLLAIMTLTFAVCSLPFTIHAFRNSFTRGGDYKEDLRVMRFLSINSIIDPWVFIILRPSVLRLIRSVLCCRMPFRSRTKNKQGSFVAKPKPMPEVDICRQ